MVEIFTYLSLWAKVKRALGCAVKEQLILHSPAEDVLPPKSEKKEMRLLPPEDIRAYLQAAERHGVLTIFYLELVTGLRKGELAALLWQDPNAARRTLSVCRQAAHTPGGPVAVSRLKTENSVREISIPRTRW